MHGQSLPLARAASIISVLNRLPHSQVPQLVQAPLVVAGDLGKRVHLDCVAGNKLLVNVNHEACVGWHGDLHVVADRGGTRGKSDCDT